MSKNLKQRWEIIQRAGGPEAYIKKELKKKGVYRSYRPNIMDIKDSSERSDAIAAARREEEERSILRAFVWEARLANNIHFLGVDIFWKDFIKNDHFDPFARSSRLKDTGLPVLESVEQFLVFIQQVVPEIDIPMLRKLCMHQEVSKHCNYRQFHIPKKMGEVRTIWAPLPRLKAIQKLIQTQIVEKMTIHGAAHGFVPGKSIYTNAQEHTNSYVVVGVDLKNFFPTFTYPRIKGIFRSYGYPQGIATLLALLCTESPRRIMKVHDEIYYVAAGPRVLPQGSPASPMLTNVACLRLDRRLSGYAQRHGWRYTRYADDLTFSSDDTGEKPDIRSLIRMIHHVTSSEGLNVHPKKTHVMSKVRRQKVTGLIVNGAQEPRVPKERRRMLRAALSNAKRGILVEDGYTLEQLIGHSAFVYSAHPELGRGLLDAFATLLGSSEE